jgi:hypothetical protein
VAILSAGVEPSSADPLRQNPGFAANVLAGNDDGSTGAVGLGFTVNFFGSSHNTVFVNNNGNVTFVNGLGQFTPFGLTTNLGTEIIAAFFADVDTRVPPSGLVQYGTDVVDGRSAFGVNYFNVGYFNQRTDRLNTFQLVLIDRSDVGPGDFDIEFNYRQVHWETGDASGGVNGLGGQSARVGFSRGTGVAGTFFELPGSGANGAFLDGGPNALVTGMFNSTVPGRYRFAVRNGGVTLPGLTPNNPFLPNAVFPAGPGTGPVFFFGNVPGTRWFDPPFVSSYLFTASPGTEFNAIQFPTGFGDNFTLSAPGCSFGGAVGSMVLVNLPSFCGGAGITSLTVSGIVPPRDAEDPLGFPTFLEFNNPTGSFSMTGLPHATPTALRVASVVGNVVTLQWSPPTDGATPTDYVLEGGVNPGDVLASIATGSPYPAFTFRAPTGVFRVRIHGVANGIRTAASNEVRLFVNAPVAPSAPTNLLGGVSGSGVALSWRNTFEGGAPSSLVLDVSGAASATIPLSVSEGIAFTGVPPGTYTLRLRAANTAGTSPPSNPITLTFPGSCAAAPNGPPQLPGNFLAQRIGNTIRVTWNAPASGPAPSQYVLNVTGSFTGSFPLGAALAVSGNVGPGSYGLSVLAANPCGPGGATPVQTIVVP